MSDTKNTDSGAAELARRATEQSPESGRAERAMVCTAQDVSSFNDVAESSRTMRLSELRLREEISRLAGGCS